MNLALRIAKYKKHGCRYCENLINVNTGGKEYIGQCRWGDNPDYCGKWQIARCMLPEPVTRLFPAEVWEQITDAIDKLLQLEVRIDEHTITSKQFDLLERWFVCETPTVAEEKTRLNGIEGHVAIAIWQRADVLGIAEDQGVKLSPEEADEILDDIDANQDCEYGISWMTLQCYVDDYVRDRDKPEQAEGAPMSVML
jgi:hypothetical protein